MDMHAGAHDDEGEGDPPHPRLHYDARWLHKQATPAGHAGHPQICAATLCQASPLVPSADWKIGKNCEMSASVWQTSIEQGCKCNMLHSREYLLLDDKA